MIEYCKMRSIFDLSSSLKQQVMNKGIQEVVG
jgi:hypothetical protein